MTEKLFGNGIMVEQFRDETLNTMKAPRISVPASAFMPIKKAEEYANELEKAIRYAKRAAIRTGTRGR
jgi:hypothetical protein